MPGLLHSRPFTLREALLQLMRRWYLIVGLGLAGTVTTLLLRPLFRPSYASEGSFRVKQSAKRLLIDASVHIPNDQPLDPALLARSMLEEGLKNSSLDRLFARYPKLFAKDLEDRDRYVEFLRKHCKVVPRSKTMFRVEVRGRGLQQAIVLVEWLTNEAMKTYVAKHTRQAALLSDFARRQAQQAINALAGHEKKMAAFLRENPVLLVQTLDADRRLEFSGADRIRVQATQRVLSRVGEAFAGNPQLQTLLEERKRLRLTAASSSQELLEARLRLGQLRSQGLTDEHPSVRAARRLVHELEARQDPAGLASPGPGVPPRLRKIDADLEQHLGAGAQKPVARLEAQWEEMAREHQLLLQQATNLGRLALNADFYGQLDSFEVGKLVSVVDPPLVPRKPVGVKPWMIVVAGIAGSHLLGALLALLLGAFDRRLHRPSEVRPLLGLPLLARLTRPARRDLQHDPATREAQDELLAWCRTEERTTVRLAARHQDGAEGKRRIELQVRSLPCHPPVAPGLFVASAPLSSAADQARALASWLFRSENEQTQVLVVASWEPGVGRTTVAANLALALGEARHRTLLLDLCPDAALTRRLGVRAEPETCLGSQLASRSRAGAPAWTFCRLAESLYLLPSDPRDAPAPALLSRPPLSDLLSQAKIFFRFIIADTPALSASSAASILEKRADSSLLVVGSSRTTLTGVELAVAQLSVGHLLGAVFNG